MSATAVRPGRASLLKPALAAAIAFAILLSLGVWQLHRRAWKLAILAEIDRAEASPPIPLPTTPLPFAKVVVHGRFRPGLQASYGIEGRDLPAGPTLGKQLIGVLDRPGQEPLLVDRGWVPDGQAVPAGGEEVVGYVREPDAPRAFSPTDDLARRHFYTLDPAKIGAALGLPHVAPYTLIALGDWTGLPQAATALPRPPNDHLNYALTWFGLALSLLAVFAAYCSKQVRSLR